MHKCISFLFDCYSPLWSGCQMVCTEFHLFWVWDILWAWHLCIFAESTMFCIANKNYDSETNKAENEKSKQHAFQLKIYLFQTNFALKTKTQKTFFWVWNIIIFDWNATFGSRLYNSLRDCKKNGLLNPQSSYLLSE